jgi:hypothetical protein
MEVFFCFLYTIGMLFPTFEVLKMNGAYAFKALEILYRSLKNVLWTF